MSFSSISSSLRVLVRKRDGNRCSYCRLLQLGQASLFHINHIVPRSKGGATVEPNLALQCPSCSLHKSAKLEVVDPQTGGAAQLFNPRTQQWTEHFRILEDGTCEGLTATGRATVAALQMNNELSLIARAFQLRTGLQSILDANS